MPYQPIENYGVIGDLQTAALVGLDGSIDFMCFPNFDSPSIFAALLDQEKGGRFWVSPLFKPVRRKQLYLPDTNVLLSRFLAQDGVAEITDFMTVSGTRTANKLVRQVRAIRGEVSFRLLFAPRFNYARDGHTVEEQAGVFYFRSQGPDGVALRFRSAVPARIENGDLTAEFKLSAGETASLVLEEAHTGEHPPPVAEEKVEAWFQETVQFWRHWVGRSRYSGRWREMVNRSALTLKLLTSARHGSIVAAPTFGLPESPGGPRNWDYRFSWIRDASFTLFALMRLGYSDEAASYMKWIEQRCLELEPDNSLQALYALDGSRELPESVLTHLEGYSRSSPVRIGNDAYRQSQLDIYGELMDAVYLYDKFGEPITYEFWTSLVRLIDWVCHHWREPDEGVWEVRGGKKEFLYSRVMCWVALDRAVRMAEKRSFPAPLDRWRQVRGAIHDSGYNEFWSQELQSFVQYKGAAVVDASSLLLPLVKFIGPHDPRWFFTLSRIERELVEDSLVYRYNTAAAASDGFSGREGTFTLCSFGYVECLSRGGNLEKARYLFEKVLGYASPVGLFAEELGPCGEHWGNYPQAFTHLSLIGAASNLDRRLSAAGKS
jgi:GH15 family glucan-1,4-alpha-glucosidase